MKFFLSNSLFSAFIIGSSIVSTNVLAAHKLSDCDNGNLICWKPQIRYSLNNNAAPYTYLSGQAACDQDTLDAIRNIPGIVVLSNVLVNDPETGLRCYVTAYNTNSPKVETQSGFGATVYAGQVCEPETTEKLYLGHLDPVLRIYPLLCVHETNFVAAVLNETPDSQCSVGNPVEVNSGAKNQREIDIDSHGIGQVGFDRTYSNVDKNNGRFWFSSYQKSLRLVGHEASNTTIREKSSSYHNRETACTAGFYDLKTKLRESWTQGSFAQFVNNVCQIVRNGEVIKTIPILPNSNHVMIRLRPGALQLVRENGSTLTFTPGTGGEYKAMNGERGQVTPVANAAPVAWKYKAANGDIEDYSIDGKLLSIIASNGIKQELFYDATSGQLSRVKDSTGRELVFAYTGNQISSVTVDGNKTTSYTYNSLGLISKVTRPNATTRIYHYEDIRFPPYLTGITDERGKRYATWKYDAQGRAISSEHAGGADKTLLEFNSDGSTTVTNALSKKTIYRFADIAGAKRVVKVEGQPTTNCAGANQDYTYATEGWLASKIDWKGIKTTYQYNSLGQETSRTEAFGTTDARTITTEWHPTLYLKTKITEPDKETTFDYDVVGRLRDRSVRSLTN